MFALFLLLLFRRFIVFNFNGGFERDYFVSACNLWNIAVHSPVNVHIQIVAKMNVFVRPTLRTDWP